MDGFVRRQAMANLVLTGTVETEQQRQSVEAAVVSALNTGSKGLTNAIENVGAATSGDRKSVLTLDRQQVASEPMLYLSRVCGVEPYSLLAALHQALDALDQHFAEVGLPVPEEVVVVYRNRLPESVMLDVGYVIPEKVQVQSGDEFKLGRTPEGTMFTAPAQYGSQDLFHVHDQLLGRARAASLSPTNFAWQRFPLKAARLRMARPTAPLYLPVS